MNLKMSPAWPETLENLATKVEAKLQQTAKQLGAQTLLKFHDRYGNSSCLLPLNQAIIGTEAKTLGDLVYLLSQNRKLTTTLLPSFQAGLSLHLLQEIDLALDFLLSQEPRPEYHGPVAKEWLREFGIGLLARKFAGVALLTAQAQSATEAAKLVQSLHSKGLLLFLSGERLVWEARKMVGGWGYESDIIPLGPEIRSLTYALGFATSFAPQFGRVTPGNLPQLKDWLRSNFHALALFFGTGEELTELAMAGALALGLAVVSEEKPSQEELASAERFLELHLDQSLEEAERIEIFLEKCLDHAGIRPIYPREPAIPVEYRPELESKSVADEDLEIELRGFELVTLRGPAQIRDGRTEIVGPSLAELGGEAPFALLVEVAGRRMRKEFESVLERQIMHFLGSAEGVEHQGSRDRTAIRLSKRVAEKGLRLEHLGHILHIGLHSQFESVVDKVQIMIYTEEEKVQKLLEKALQIYRERDERVAKLRDEMVEDFYSCLSCQSLTPYHLCVVTPERPGMCGAINYLDCQASYEINPEGQNQPIPKKGAIDPVKGEWESINHYVQDHTQKKLSRFCLNSVLDDPPTISSLCECITTLIPEANGVMVIDREDSGPTPLGMTFSELLSLGTGTQSPGFIGHSRAYIISEKFLAAEGGIKRVVWMSCRLKDELREGLQEACRRAGEPDLLDKIGDGESTPTFEELLSGLEKKKHPALDMPPIM